MEFIKTWQSVILIFIVYIFLTHQIRLSKKIILFDVFIAILGCLAAINGLLWKNIVVLKFVCSAPFLFLGMRILVKSLKKRLQAFFITTADILYLLFPVANLSYYIAGGHAVGSDSIFAIAQTNLMETISFISSQIGLFLSFALVVILLWLIIYKVNLLLPEVQYRFSAKTSICLLILYFIVADYLFTKVMPHSESCQAYNDYKIMMQQLANKKVPSDLQVYGTRERFNAVIVIGESANRDYMSAYGFDKNTTPWMHDMINNRHFILFNNAYSSDKLTQKVLALALSEKDQYNKMPLEKAALITDILHKAQYKVYWLSNQGAINNLHESFSIIALSADTHIFINANGPILDEKLLDKIPKSNNKGNVLVIHIIGSHGNYIDRSPADYKTVFYNDIPKGPDDLNQYCDSILYTDHVLQEIYTKCKKDFGMDAFIYFSDHGEKPGVPRDQFDYAMTRIPLVMWFSDAYIANNKKQFDTLINHKNSYFTNDMLYDTIIGVTGIKSNHYDSKNDLSSPNYVWRRKDLLTISGTKKVIDDPYDKAVN